MKTLLPSPALAIVGRHNSGKTTLIEALIAQLCVRGIDVGSIKHHSHIGFDIDVPGKDSYRHRAAGANEILIAAPDQMAQIKTLDHEIECAELVARMPGHDIVLVEGYRKSGLPTIEIMRTGNAADEQVAAAFLECAKAGEPLSSDFVQRARWQAAYDPTDDRVAKMPHANDHVAALPTQFVHLCLRACKEFVIAQKREAHHVSGVCGGKGRRCRKPKEAHLGTVR